MFLKKEPLALLISELVSIVLAAERSYIILFYATTWVDFFPRQDCYQNCIDDKLVDDLIPLEQRQGLKMRSREIFCKRFFLSFA